MNTEQKSKMPTWKVIVLIATSLPILIWARWYWQTHVGFWPCLLFWIIALTDDPIRFMDMGSKRKLFYAAAFVGACCNAVATLLNGGTMPVSGKTDTTSVWVPLTETSRVPWLCDIYSGASIGDIFIASALLALLLNWICEKLEWIPKEQVATGKRIPGFGIG